MSKVEDLHAMYTTSRERLTHFLMGSAGAALGFCITLKPSFTFAWPDILVIAATVLFAVSFWAGVKLSSAMQDVLFANFNYLQFADQYPPVEAIRAQLREIADEVSFNPIDRRIFRWIRIQRYSLISGAITLMCWRVAEGYPDFVPFDLISFTAATDGAG